MTHTKSTIVAAVIAVPLNLTALVATGQDTPDVPAATVLGFTQGEVIPVNESAKRMTSTRRCVQSRTRPKRGSTP